MTIKNLTRDEKPTKSVYLRLSEREKKELQNLANQYTNGNVNAWLLYCALNYKPKKKELER